MLMSFCSFHTAQSKTPSSYSQVTSLFVCRLFLRLCLQFRCFILAFLRSVPWQITMFRCSGFALLLPVFCKVPSLFSPQYCNSIALFLHFFKGDIALPHYGCIVFAFILAIVAHFGEVFLLFFRDVAMFLHCLLHCFAFFLLYLHNFGDLSFAFLP